MNVSCKRSALSVQIRHRARFMNMAACVVFIMTAASSQAQSLDQPSQPPLWTGTQYNDAMFSTGAHRLHAIGITGQGLTTAIVDAGFYTNHEIFNGNVIVNNYSGDEDHHGTHVAGIALSMAPGSTLWLGHYGDGEDADGEAVFGQILSDASRYNIVSINNSWGDPLEGGYPDSASVDQNNPRTAAMVAQLAKEGIAIAGSSGNSAINDRMSYPDGLSGIISVGSLSQYGYLNDSSVFYQKDGFFLVAPGRDVYSAMIVDGQGKSTYAQDSGTSMASPHVAGAITLLKSGARNASSKEIIAALYDSAIRIPYDGNAILPKQYVEPIDPTKILKELTDLTASNTHLKVYIDWVDACTKKNNLTADEWRTLARIYVAAISVIAPPDGKAEALKKYLEYIDALTPLRHTEYGFIQVDAAYRLLTNRRSLIMTDGATATGSSHSSAMEAFGSEMGLALDRDTSELFQRLDGQPGNVLARAARQLGPAFIDATMQSSNLGMLSLHGMAGRRFDLFENRDHLAAFSHAASTAIGEEPAEPAPSPEGYMCLADLPKRWTLWGEGFGGYYHRNETTNGSGYNGSFAGAMVGIEQAQNDVLLGGFAAWANHAIRGDGRSRGNWGTLGLYAGASRDAFSLGFSVAGGLGDYGITREIDGPAASLIGMNYAPITLRTEGDSHALSLSARATAGWRLLDREGWTAGPAVEASFAHSRMSGYDEHNGGALRLSVDRHTVNYLEGGAGVRASKSFVKGCRPFVLSAKVMGLYGRSFTSDMTGAFSTGGSPYRVEPEETKSFWCVPEASLTWKASERVTVTASYQGRFGRHTAVNTGALSVGITW